MDNYQYSKCNSFTAYGLNRAHDLRTDLQWVAARMHDPDTRIIPVWQTQNLFLDDPSPQPVWVSPADLGETIEMAESLTFLGITEEHSYFALGIPDEDTPLLTKLRAHATQGQFRNLRRIAALLDRRTGGLLAYARAITYWHHQHRFCGVCGSPTTSSDAGNVRVCTNPQCRQQHFPRVDPAIIVLTQCKGERGLLGRKAEWPAGRYSTIAGFVEPGESFEDAVAREVYEETGVGIMSASYQSSQPWPFPSSLMVGFYASADCDTIQRHDGELEDARWFTRQELKDGIEQGTVVLPPSLAISFRLIEGWFDRGNLGRLREIVPPREW